MGLLELRNDNVRISKRELYMSTVHELIEKKRYDHNQNI